jgi:hypothetical protein
MIDLKQYLEKLMELKMSPNQFFFCYLLHNDRFPELYEYVENVGRFDKEEIKDLLRRGFIQNINENKNFTADAFVTTEKFSKKFLADKYEYAKEFFEAYPSFGSIDGRPIVLKSISPDKFYEMYNYITGKQKSFHDRIMNALKIGKKMSLVNMKIEKWLDSKQWMLIEKDIKYASKPGDREFTAD